MYYSFKYEKRAATAILVVFLLLLLFSSMCCAPAAHSPASEAPGFDSEQNLPMMERVCRLSQVSCYGGEVFIRGTKNWTLIVDGYVIRHEPLTYLQTGISSRDVAKGGLRVETDPSVLNRWPRTGAAAIIINTRTGRE